MQFILFTLALIIALPLNALSSEVNCLMCHEQLSKEKVVHLALQMGCNTCHIAIDAKDIPHKKTNNIPKGLSSGQPDICFNCHNKGIFTKKTVHSALSMGCTTCHNPHSSKNQRLLISESPDLCYNCHDRKKFDGKTIHPPVAGGMCTSCHNPHSTNTPKLLVAEAPDLCFNCHDKAEFSKKNVHSPVAVGMCTSCHGPHVSDNIALLIKPVDVLCFTCHTKKDLQSGLHVVRSFNVGSGGHPLRGKPDPKRKDRELSCSSCHNPHSSNSSKLFRYKAQNLFELCIHCHEK